MTTTSSSSNKAAKPPTALSPHLQIWRFTVTMAASITHRGTGVALYAGTALLALWLYAAASSSPTVYGLINSIINSPFGLFVLAAYSWALFFHILCGLRYLFWDRGMGFELETAKKTAWGAYIGATLLMVIVMATGLFIAGGV